MCCGQISSFNLLSFNLVTFPTLKAGFFSQSPVSVINPYILDSLIPAIKLMLHYST